MKHQMINKQLPVNPQASAQCVSSGQKLMMVYMAMNTPAPSHCSSSSFGIDLVFIPRLYTDSSGVSTGPLTFGLNPHLNLLVL